MIKNKKKLLWITWEVQRRNRTLSSALSAELAEIEVNMHRIFRYPISIYRTISVIARYKPDVIIVQNPSIILALLGVFLNTFSRLRLAIDAHNAGLFPTEDEKSILNNISRYIIRNTPLTIVTNDVLARYVNSLGGYPAVLPDPIPEFEYEDINRDKRKFNVLFICSWASDEPYGEVIKAGQLLLDADCDIYITGKSGGKESDFAPLPSNVILTGYLSESSFVSRIYKSDLIIDLTTRDDCLVCGAYEGVAAEKPLLLSGTPALRKYFSKGALYTDNTASDIAKKVIAAKEDVITLQKDVKHLKNELSENWKKDLSKLEEQLDTLVQETAR